MDIPRWTIAELATRYELEPTLRDMFVEGQFDVDIIATVHRSIPLEPRSIYSADVIEICSEAFKKHQLTFGNKQKILILCRELARLGLGENVRFLVDKDIDHWFGSLENCRGLAWTEYCDLETYFFDEGFSAELILNAGKAKIQNWDWFYKSFCRTLKLLYLVRLAARDIAVPLDYTDFKKLLVIDGSVILFDVAEYTRRNLLKIGEAGKLTEFNESMRVWDQKINGDPRQFCRGHDFIKLIAWSIQRFKGVTSLGDLALERVFVLLAPRIAEKFRPLA